MNKEAVFFDLDNTICKHNTGIKFTTYLLKNNKLSFKQSFAIFIAFCKYKFRIANDIAKQREKLFYTVFNGFLCTNIITLYNDFFNKVLIRSINNDIYEALRSHKIMNRDIWIVSASLDFFVKPFAKYLQIDKYLASNAEIKNGKLTGRLFNDLYQNKQIVLQRLAIKHGYDLNLCYAYTDSIHDKDILSCVGHPIAVNPDKQLRKLALLKGWSIEKWR